AAIDHSHTDAGAVETVLQRNIGVDRRFDKLQMSPQFPVRGDVFDPWISGYSTQGRRRNSKHYVRDVVKLCLGLSSKLGDLRQVSRCRGTDELDNHIENRCRRQIL